MTDSNGILNQNLTEVCLICCNPIKIYAYGKCLHTICYKCSLRMRVLCEQNYCPVCRADLEKVIYSNTFIPSEVEFLENNQRPDQIPKWGIYFNSKDIHDMCLKLLEHPCICCLDENAPKNLSMGALKEHLKILHDRYFCDICVTHLKIFTIERSVYTLEELATHRRCGDGKMGDKSHKGHPLCEFCDRRYLDNENLFKHLRRDHYFCHFCEADGYNQYYNDYPILRDHFRAVHFLCEEGDCKHEKFITAFRSELDLKAHRVDKHSHGLDRASQRLLRSVDISFNYAPRNQREYRGNYPRDSRARPADDERGAGRRDHDANHPGGPQRQDRRHGGGRRFETGTLMPDERDNLRSAGNNRHSEEQSNGFPEYGGRSNSYRTDQSANFNLTQPRDRGNMHQQTQQIIAAPEFYHRRDTSRRFYDGPDDGTTFHDEGLFGGGYPSFTPDVDFPTLATSGSATTGAPPPPNGQNLGTEGTLFMPKPFTAAIARTFNGISSSGVDRDAMASYPSLPRKDTKIQFKSHFGINTRDKKTLDEAFPALAPTTTKRVVKPALSHKNNAGSASTTVPWSVSTTTKSKKTNDKKGASTISHYKTPLTSDQNYEDDSVNERPSTPPGFTRISSKGSGAYVLTQLPAQNDMYELENEEFPQLAIGKSSSNKGNHHTANPSVGTLKSTVTGIDGTLKNKNAVKIKKSVNFSTAKTVNPNGAKSKESATATTTTTTSDETDDEINEFHLLKPLDLIGKASILSSSSPNLFPSSSVLRVANTNNNNYNKAKSFLPNREGFPSLSHPSEYATTTPKFSLPPSSTMPRPYVEPPATSFPRPPPPDKSAFPSLPGNRNKNRPVVIGKGTLQPPNIRSSSSGSSLDQLIARLNGPPTRPIPGPIMSSPARDSADAVSGARPTLPFSTAALNKLVPSQPRYHDDDDRGIYSSDPYNIPDMANENDFPVL